MEEAIEVTSPPYVPLPSPEQDHDTGSCLSLESITHIVHEQNMARLSVHPAPSFPPPIPYRLNCGPFIKALLLSFLAVYILIGGHQLFNSSIDSITTYPSHSRYLLSLHNNTTPSNALHITVSICCTAMTAQIIESIDVQNEWKSIIQHHVHNAMESIISISNQSDQSVSLLLSDPDTLSVTHSSVITTEPFIEFTSYVTITADLPLDSNGIDAFPEHQTQSLQLFLWLESTKIIDELTSSAIFLSGEEFVNINWIHPRFGTTTSSNSETENAEITNSEWITETKNEEEIFNAQYEAVYTRSTAESLRLSFSVVAIILVTLAAVLMGTFYLVTN